MGYFKKLLTAVTILSVITVSSFAMKAEYRFADCGGATTSKEHTSSGLDGFLNSNAKVTVGDGKIENTTTLLGNGSVPSINLLGVIVILIITGLLGVLFIQREELYKNQTKDNR